MSQTIYYVLRRVNAHTYDPTDLDIEERKKAKTGRQKKRKLCTMKDKWCVEGTLNVKMVVSQIRRFYFLI